MANAISGEELQLKKRARRRLVGAVALVIVVVIFLPMFLANKPKPLNQDIAINIPPVPAEQPASEGGTTAPPVPLGASAPPAQPVAGMPQGEPAREPAPDAVDPVPKVVVKPATKPVQAKPSPAEKSPATEEFMVQLGAFSNGSNARALQKKLQDNKFKAHAELIKAPGGDRTRVRVGPYASREAAEKARERLKALKLVIGEATVVRQGE